MDDDTRARINFAFQLLWRALVVMGVVLLVDIAMEAWGSDELAFELTTMAVGGVGLVWVMAHRFRGPNYPN